MRPIEYIRSIGGENPGTIASGSDIKVSSLLSYESVLEKSPFSVKFVLSGEEHYTINRQTYTIGSGSFLIVNEESPLELEIKGETTTTGVCFYPSLQMLFEVSNASEKPFSLEPEKPVSNACGLEFVEKVYRAHENNTGYFLLKHMHLLRQMHETGLEAENNEEFMVGLCESLISDKITVQKMLNSLPSRKKSTREELYRRASRAENYIRENFTEEICLDAVAEKALLSKYHFLRSFKAVYGVSPIRYLLNLKLEKAFQLRKQDYSYTQISAMVGYSDPQNLRKALRSYKILRRPVI